MTITPTMARVMGSARFIGLSHPLRFLGHDLFELGVVDGGGWAVEHELSGVERNHPVGIGVHQVQKMETAGTVTPSSLLICSRWRMMLWANTGSRLATGSSPGSAPGLA